MKSQCIPLRFVVLLLCVIMAAILYLTRINFSVTIVAMTVSTERNKSNKTSTETCDINEYENTNSTTFKKNGEFNWSQKQQGIILGAFFYGYILFQVVGGRLSEIWGAKWLCGSGILISGIINLLTPVIARWNFTALIISRILLGITQSVDFPAGYTLLTHWFPEQELATALGIFTAGTQLGAIITMVLSGYLSSTNFLGGWPSVFYTSGAITCVWFLFWVIFVVSEPEKHYFITEKELNYIKDNRALKSVNYRKTLKAPWLAILTSKPVLATIIAKFCGAWSFNLVLSKIPAYLQSVLHYSIDKNGYMMALIYISMAISMSSGGIISDYIINKKLINKTLVRKIFQSISSSGSSISLILIPLVKCDKTAAIALLMLAMLSFGQVSGGEIPIIPDMTTNFPATVIAIANSVATLTGIFVPLFVGYIIEDDQQSRILWSYVFYTSALLNIFGVIVFLIWSDANVQHWNNTQTFDNLENTVEDSIEQSINNNNKLVYRL